MEYVLFFFAFFFCLLGFIVLFDVALGESDSSIPRDVIKRRDEL